MNPFKMLQILKTKSQGTVWCNQKSKSSKEFNKASAALRKSHLIRPAKKYSTHTTHNIHNYASAQYFYHNKL